MLQRRQCNQAHQFPSSRRRSFAAPSSCAIRCASLIFAVLYFGGSYLTPAQSSSGINCFTQIDPIYQQTDVRSLMTIRTAADLLAKRNALVKFLWDGGEFPSAKLPAPEDVKIGVAPPLADLPNLKSVEQLTVRLRTINSLDARPRPISIIYFLHPVIRSGRLAIFHQGHEDWPDPLFWNGGQRTINAFLEQGYDVLAMQMPICGENMVAPFQNCVDAHQSIGDVVNPDFNFLQLFVEPVAVALNYATRQATYQQIVMTGVSGGGWTTVLYAALDSRVQVSLPVAGSLPYYLRTGPCGERDFGDWEQIALGKFIDYTDLYLLGAYGEGRSQVQAFNQYDDCCFSGIRYQTYEPAVRDVLSGIGPGSFRVFLDGGNQSHSISSATLVDFVEAVNAFFPSLMTAQGTREAIALDAQTMRQGPFTVFADDNLGPDKRRRLVIFARHIPADAVANQRPLEVRAEVAATLQSSALPVEYAGPVPGTPELTQLIIRLPEELLYAGQIWLSVKVDEKTSVSGFVQIN